MVNLKIIQMRNAHQFLESALGVRIRRRGTKQIVFSLMRINQVSPGGNRPAQLFARNQIAGRMQIRKRRKTIFADDFNGFRLKVGLPL